MDVIDMGVHYSITYNLKNSKNALDILLTEKS